MEYYVDCKICCAKNVALPGTKLCDGCWEVDRRLSGFLSHPNGIKAVCEELAEADPKFTCLRNLAPDEPVFILKAKDKVASTVVAIWATLAGKAGTAREKIQMALQTAEAMEAWGNLNQTKVPD